MEFTDYLRECGRSQINIQNLHILNIDVNLEDRALFKGFYSIMTINCKPKELDQFINIYLNGQFSTHSEFRRIYNDDEQMLNALSVTVKGYSDYLKTDT